MVEIIGGGLAGCEAAMQLAKRNISVNLYEMRPKNTFAHKGSDLAELVCSNSLKSVELTNAHGLLKEELTHLDSFVLTIAKKNKIPGGKALVVDRDKFSKDITEIINKNPKINLIRKEVKNIPEGIIIIATGPMSSENIINRIKDITGQNFLYFTDAIAPIITKECINFNKCFYASRYNVGKDYINCPFSKKEYEDFVESIISAEKLDINKDKEIFFQGCMPVEELAKRGQDTLRFGLLKPKGIFSPNNEKEFYAICQLRRETKTGDYWNMVGFQTRLKFSEQKKVFSKIPGLENIEIIRYGQAHKNIYINSPKLLEENSFFLKKKPKIAFAGQITGVEGYVESIATGLLTAIEVNNKIKNIDNIFPDEFTILGGIIKKINTISKNYQPFASSFSLVPLENIRIRNKKEKKKFLSERAIEHIVEWKRKYF